MEFGPASSHIRVSQVFVADVENHLMETAGEPAEKRIDVPFFRPDGRNTMPAIQLLLEDLVADSCQVFQRLLIGFPLRQQVYRRLQLQIFQCQMRAGWIH
jgi:hypothetical protein